MATGYCIPGSAISGYVYLFIAYWTTRQEDGRDEPMFSQTAEYALRAMVFLASQGTDDQLVAGQRIAHEIDVPAKYLQKIMGDLVRAGLLHSAPGKTGGFALARRPENIRLSEILAPFERLKSGTCPFGNQVCGDANPCRAHDEWKKVVECERRFLAGNTLADVSAPENTKRRPRVQGKRRT